MIKWFLNLFKKKEHKIKRLTFMLPDGWYIKKTKSHWDGGYITTYIAYRVEKDKGQFDDDYQIASCKTWRLAAYYVWKNYRLHKQFQNDCKTEKSLKGI